LLTGGVLKSCRLCGARQANSCRLSGFQRVASEQGRHKDRLLKHTRLTVCMSKNYLMQTVVCVTRIRPLCLPYMVVTLHPSISYATFVSHITDVASSCGWGKMVLKQLLGWKAPRQLAADCTTPIRRDHP